MSISGSSQPSFASHGSPPPRFTPQGQHVRRPSRPQSHLETLVERELELEIPPAAPLVDAPRARPTSKIMATSTQSHMPRSIFPDVPTSRRASTTPAFHATVSSAHPAARYQMARRHTTSLAPAVIAGPRREARPLRSSPLAGPSLALSDDGTLMGSGENAAGRPRPKPNRISSTPDVSTETLMKLEGRTTASAPSSPTGTLRGAPPPSLALEAAQQKSGQEQMPTPPSPTRSSSIRRLSIGLKRLSTLPGMSKPSVADAAASTSPGAGVSRATSLTVSGSPSGNRSGGEEASVPPVPSIPVWAKPSYIAGAAPTAGPSTLRSVEVAAPATKSILRRPSTAPSSTPSQDSLSHRSSVYSSHETLPRPGSPAGSTTPSTSRSPELNWLSAAAAPRFSRLGLKGEGVVLPLTAKEVRRRSTIRMSSTDGADARSLASMHSATSLRSLAASVEAIAEDDVRPPRPAFRREASASSSSVASTASAESDGQTTPSLSRASSESGASVEEVHSPREPEQDEFGVLSPAALGKESGSAGVELRVNDVTVEIIDLGEKTERVRTQGVHVSGVDAKHGKGAEAKTKKPVLERRGTLKRVWKKLTGGGKG